LGEVEGLVSDFLHLTLGIQSVAWAYIDLHLTLGIRPLELAELHGKDLQM
jgi:hypothetical protein